MNTQTKCIIAEAVGEYLIGGSIGIILKKKVLPECNKVESVVVMGGVLIGTYFAGRAFGKAFYKFCDKNFVTEPKTDEPLEEEL